MGYFLEVKADGTITAYQKLAWPEDMCEINAPVGWALWVRYHQDELPIVLGFHEPHKHYSIRKGKIYEVTSPEGWLFGVAFDGTLPRTVVKYGPKPMPTLWEVLLDSD